MSIRQNVWISDSNVQPIFIKDKRIIFLRQIFIKAMEQQSKNYITYYDFLLIAKKLNFRFEESNHLMELRKYFFKHKNSLQIKRLAQLLMVFNETLEQINGQRLPQKIIIRFQVSSDQFQSIKQVTNQDEEMAEDEGQHLPYSKRKQIPLNRMQIMQRKEEDQQYKQKLTIILSIKVSEMMKKVKLLTEGVTEFYENEEIRHNLYTIFDQLTKAQIQFEIFKKGIVNFLKKIEAQLFRQKLAVSEDDIKSLFFILDEQKNNFLTRQKLKLFEDEAALTQKITKFYENRINKKMVKNTLFKLGKNTNSIQIYQAKNASILEFKSIQDAILDRKDSKQKIVKSKIPHFGPIKGFALKNSPSKNKINLLESQRSKTNKSSLSTYKADSTNLQKEREKIERIIRSSKQQKKKKNGQQTIASKLRSLFIHKVILPRQKLLEEEKNKYGPHKSQSGNLITKLI